MVRWEKVSLGISFPLEALVSSFSIFSWTFFISSSSSSSSSASSGCFILCATCCRIFCSSSWVSLEVILGCVSCFFKSLTFRIDSIFGKRVWKSSGMMPFSMLWIVMLVVWVLDASCEVVIFARRFAIWIVQL